MTGSSGDKENTFSKGNNRSPLSLRSAEKEIKENNFARAIEILESIINGNPSNAAPYFLLGRAYAGDGNYRTALQNFRKGSDIIGSEKTYQYYLREIESLRRKHEGMEISGSASSSDFIKLFGRTAEIKTSPPGREPDIDENLISETLAKIYLSQGENGEAIRVYEKLIRKYPLKTLYFQTKITEIRSGIK